MIRQSTFYILIAISFYSCLQSKKEKAVSTPKKADSVSISSKQKKYDAEDLLDSLNLDQALKHAVNIAAQHVTADNYSEKYDTQPLDSSFVITNEIKMGHLFSKTDRHLLIRSIYWDNFANIDLYHIKGGKFIPLVHREHTSLGYVGDEIKDVNGDGLRDFLVHSYSNTGCCRRNVYHVYLRKENNGLFTDEYTFMNPTFSPNEKVIRGIDYGHPGEVGMYKYKWNGFKVDTIEFIRPDPTDTIHRYYVKTLRYRYYENPKKIIKLKSVPEEYRHIESFEWFNDY